MKPHYAYIYIYNDIFHGEFVVNCYQTVFQVTPSDVSQMNFGCLWIWVCIYSAVKPDIAIIVGILFLAMLIVYDEKWHRLVKPGSQYDAHTSVHVYM